MNTQTKTNGHKPSAAKGIHLTAPIEGGWRDLLRQLSQKPDPELAERALAAVEQACQKGEEPVMRGIAGLVQDRFERYVLAGVTSYSSDMLVFKALDAGHDIWNNDDCGLPAALLVDWLSGKHKGFIQALARVLHPAGSLRRRGLIYRTNATGGLDGRIWPGASVSGLEHSCLSDEYPRTVEAGMTLEMPQENMDQIVLSEKQKSEIDSFIDIAKAGRNPKILLHGKPGTGKTILARALSQKLNKPLLVIESPEEHEPSSYFLRRSFQHAAAQNAILYLDECSRWMRADPEGGLSEEAAMMLTLLEDHPGPVLAMTNRVADLFQPFMRRFPIKIRFECPTETEREKIWEVLSKDEVEPPLRKRLAGMFRMTGGQIRNALGVAGDKKDEQSLVAACVSQILSTIEVNEYANRYKNPGLDVLSGEEKEAVQQSGKLMKAATQAILSDEKLFKGNMNSGYKVRLNSASSRVLHAAVFEIAKQAAMKPVYFSQRKLIRAMKQSGDVERELREGLAAFALAEMLPVLSLDGDDLGDARGCIAVMNMFENFMGPGVVTELEHRSYSKKTNYYGDKTLCLEGRRSDGVEKWIGKILSEIEIVNVKLSARGACRMYQLVKKLMSFNSMIRTAAAICISDEGQEGLTLRHLKMAIRHHLLLSTKNKKIKKPIFGNHQGEKNEQ